MSAVYVHSQNASTIINIIQLSYILNMLEYKEPITSQDSIAEPLDLIMIDLSVFTKPSVERVT